MSLIAQKWLQFTQWAAYAAWNHARKRAIRRERWLPQDAADAQRDQTPDQRRIHANEAGQVLQNKHFRGAWDALNEHLEAQVLGCNTNTKEGREQAANVVATKQLLHGLRREFLRKLDDGYMAEVELEEIHKRARLLRFRR